MRLTWEPFTVHKRFALTISRGTSSESTNFWIRLDHEGIQGWGEASPFAIDVDEQSQQVLLEGLRAAVPLLDPLSPWQLQRVERILAEARIPSAVRAAIDMACHDWRGKSLRLPLWQVWGSDLDRIPLTSVTIGINTPEAARKRAYDWIEFADVRAFKVKLGSPAGIRADQEMLLAIQEVIPTGALLTVDANGGWTQANALHMCNWLAGQGVRYVEQPLPPNQEDLFATLWHQSPLPIFADESCRSSQQIPTLLGKVHGINIKLMKSGGLSEGVRMAQIARAHGLQVMLGCYGDSALANSAAAQLGSLADYLDLDSHLNLVDDPFVGAILSQGRLLPTHEPGLGVQRRADHA